MPPAVAAVPRRMQCRDSRTRKLHLDYDERAARRCAGAAPTQAAREGLGGGGKGGTGAEIVAAAAAAAAVGQASGPCTGGSSGGGQQQEAAATATSGAVRAQGFGDDLVSSLLVPGRDPFGCSSARKLPRFKF